jgi:glutaredoxin
MKRHPGLLVALLGLAALGATCKGKEPEPPAVPPSAPAAPEGKAPAVQAIPGIELAELEPAVRGDALRLLNETFCYCGCARTVAACLVNKADCGCVQCSERMASFIMGEYRAGASTEDVEEQLLEGFSQGFNGRPQPLDQADQPEKGPAQPAVTIVEFADFRCPHCAAAFEVLEELAKRHPEVRVRFYYFPLSGMGEKSVRAAEAAEEARAQGKFWELAALMFRNQHALEPEDIAGYAKEVGMDVAKLAAALDQHTHLTTVMDDKRLGESVGVKSTPTLFVDGRPFGLGRTLENLELRLAMEKARGRCD